MCPRIDVDDIDTWDTVVNGVSEEEVYTTFLPVSLKTHGGGEWLDSSWLQIQMIQGTGLKSATNFKASKANKLFCFSFLVGQTTANRTIRFFLNEKPRTSCADDVPWNEWREADLKTVKKMSPIVTKKSKPTKSNSNNAGEGAWTDLVPFVIGKPILSLLLLT